MANILIIEDETSLLEVYSEVLRSGGHNVITASEGDKGIETAKNSEWDLMFLDVMLPNNDGVSILRELSNHDLLKDKVVVMLTALDTPAVIAESMRLGAKKHINKAESDPQVLLDTVEQYFPSTVKPKQE